MLFGHREEPRRSPPGMLGERVKTNRNGAQKITLGQGQAGMGAEGDGADSRAVSGCGLQGEGSPMSPDEWKRLGVGRSAQVWRRASLGR